MPKLIDETGNRHGRLTVIKRAENHKSKAVQWLCQCDCGNEVVVRGDSLRSGNTKSCGCLHDELAVKSCKARTLPEGEAVFHALFHDYKRRAKEKELRFELTEGEFRKLTKQPCYYCGSPPKQIGSISECNGDYIYNGVDRIDNAVGYTLDNVVSCCKTCNYAKRQMSQQEFFNWIQKVYGHLEQKHL